MRVRLPSLFFSLLVIAAISSPPVAAQDQAPLRLSASETHLSEISSSLARIADLLESQIKGRRLDLVMQRIELRQRRLAPLESRLRSARASRRSDLHQRLRLESQLEDTANQFESGVLEIEPAELSRMTDHFESELALIKARMQAADDQIAALENEVTRYRNEIEDWESWVDRELSDL